MHWLLLLLLGVISLESILNFGDHVVGLSWTKVLVCSSGQCWLRRVQWPRPHQTLTATSNIFLSLVTGHSHWCHRVPLTLLSVTVVTRRLDMVYMVSETTAVGLCEEMLTSIVWAAEHSLVLAAQDWKLSSLDWRQCSCTQHTMLAAAAHCTQHRLSTLPCCLLHNTPPMQLWYRIKLN